MNKLFYKVIAITVLLSCTYFSNSQRNMEKLDRGLVAVQTNGGVFLSWRVYGTDPSDVAFNIYRNGTLVNQSPITGATNITDGSGTSNATYTVKPIINGIEKEVDGTATVWASQTKEITLNRPAAGITDRYEVTNKGNLESYPNGQEYSYQPDDINIGDLDGDGEYELVVKWNPSNARDNAYGGITGPVYIDAYKLDGTFMWRVSLGVNIRAGSHYTQHLVADFDGDGKAEMICKTAEGTKDGQGNFLSSGPAENDDDAADYPSDDSWPGFISEGPEYLTIFNGETGAEMQTVTFQVGRGDTDSWGKTGDNTNRVDRFNSTIAYLDGVKPSAIFNRGYYGKMTHSAWDWDGSNLTNRWIFNSADAGNSAAAGNGNHSMMSGDADGDGFDEIFTGSASIDHNGTFRWSTGYGHGDACHIGDLNPDRPGLEIWQVSESSGTEPDHYMIDARTGEVLWRAGSGNDNGRGMCGDIDASHRGQEAWSARGPNTNTCTGQSISANKPAMNFRVYWDGDLQDELLDGSTISKWTGNGSTTMITLPGWSCNGTKATPNFSGDILGDWREEVILHYESSLLITTTTIPTQHKLYTLMHDPLYRNAISWQQSSYNQPPHLSFFLGDGVENAPTPDIVLVGATRTDCNGVENGSAYMDACETCVGGNTGLEPCVLDCNGIENGSAYLDNCGTCVGGNTGLSECSLMQAEDACEFLGVLETTNAGFNGASYVNSDNVIGANIAIKASSAQSSNAVMTIRYANGGDTDRPFALIVNDNQAIANVSMNPTGSWTNWETIHVEFSALAGVNIINFVATTNLGLGNMDEIWFNTEGVQPTTCEEPDPITISLTAGWNLISYPVEGSTPLQTALSSVWENVEVVKDFDGFFDKSNDPSLNSLSELLWGKGYFIFVSSNCELIIE